MDLDEQQQMTWDYCAIPDPSNFFQQHRLKNDKIWMNRQRVAMSMTTMTPSHIQNCIIMLAKSSQSNTKAYRGLKAELAKRAK
jgi:hypothetical protein